MLRNATDITSLTRRTCIMCAIAAVALAAGCTQKRSRGWAQFSPIIQANPTQDEPEPEASLSARTDRDGEMADKTGNVTQ